MSTLNINPALIMNTDDRKAFESLPENMPDTSYTQKQKEAIFKMYHTYFNKIDNIDWSTDCFAMEMKENWPTGPRMKKHHAMCICLGFIHNLKPVVTIVDVWHSNNGRDSYRKIYKYAYNPYANYNQVGSR